MLRVAKPTSPMSVGTWILTAFGPAAGVAAIAEAAGWLPGRGARGWRLAAAAAGDAAGLVAAGPRRRWPRTPAVLLADTAVPSWHEAYPELPVIFAGSAGQRRRRAGCWLRLRPVQDTARPARLAVAGAALELCGAHRVETHASACSASPTRRAAPAGCCGPAGR